MEGEGGKEEEGIPNEDVEGYLLRDGITAGGVRWMS
jgi:hypothetical protein